MAPKTYIEAYKTDMLAFWHDVTKIKKPVIAGESIGYKRVIRVY